MNDNGRITDTQAAELEAEHQRIKAQGIAAAPFRIMPSEEAELADMLREALDALKQARIEIKTTRGLIDRLEAELATKTSVLRRLQDERDPNVIAERVAAAVEASAEFLEVRLRAKESTIETLQRENAELRASKKKLRDALERAKEGRTR